MDIIFDVDGTLLNIEHRVPLIRPVNGNKKDWTAFRNAAVHDTPNEEITFLAKTLYNQHDVRLIICTGRMEKERKVTLETLAAHGVNASKMYMRPNDDVRPDHVVKLEMLIQLRADGYDPKLVFDDRQQVVDMWRSVGLRVCQVAEGKF